MKKIRTITIVSLLVLLLTAIFTGCSIIENILGSFGGKTLDAPTNLKYSDGELSWSQVDGATSYEIRLEREGEAEVILTSDTAKVSIPDDLIGSFTAYVKAISKSKESDYSAGVSFTFGKLILDESSFKFDFETLMLSWDACPYAYNYSIKVKEGSKVIDSRNVSVTYYYYPQEYDSHYRYVFEVTALPASNTDYTPSSAVSYIIQPELDFSSAEDFVIDLSNDFEYFTITNPNVNHMAINRKDQSVDNFIDYSSSCIASDDGFSIPRSIVEEYAYGTYYMIVGGDDFDLAYIFKVIDSRTPIVTCDVNRHIVENDDSLFFTYQTFAYSLKNVSINSVPLSSSEYTIDENVIALSASFLDELPLGKYTLKIVFTSLFDSSEKSVDTNFYVSSDIMVLNTYMYNYIKGEDLYLDVKTNGDRVANILVDKVAIPTSSFDSAKNTVIIFAEYLDSTTADTFTIETVSGSILVPIKINRNLKGFIPSKQSYTYDKSGESLLLDGFMENTIASVYGNNITKNSFATSSKGITLQDEYLDTLAVGEYTFLVECGETFSYVTVEVVSNSKKIENLHFDFDIEENEVYIRFDCCCGKEEHYYSLDSGESVHADSIQKIPDFSIDSEHSVKVSCSTYSTSSTISYEVPDSEELTYMREYFSLKGNAYNKVIGSLEELAKVFEYLAFGGSGVEYTYNGTSYEYGCASDNVYFTDSLISAMRENNDYFSEVVAIIDSPYSCGYSLKQISGGSNVFSLLVSYSENIQKTQTSGMKKESLNDDRSFLTESERSNSFNDFAINSFTKTELITSTEELASLPYGVKPIFEGESEAKTIYENCLNILRKYVSSDYTDIEKVTAIFHWIVSNITYDNNTLALYNLSDYLQSTSLSLVMAKDVINDQINNNSSLESLLAPATTLTSVDDIRSYMKNLSSKMRAFSLEGAIIDNVAVCDGISDAFKLLCLIEGIPTIKVSGVGVQNNGSENHAWNKVQIDGVWYVVDATWGRSSGYVSHKYFLVAEEDVIHDHIEGVMGSSNRSYSVVDTLATGSYDYYANTILYKQSSLIADRDALKRMVKDFISSGDEVLEVKLEFDFTESQLHDLMKEVFKGSYKYRIGDGYLFLMI